ncbi:YdeI/OmpD-associated family protein [Leptospira johnsonii]|uniref:Bacteriocin-protection protein, YdeI/OmpD-associated family n=1 Tax=Leptospira johnsonii TaxID=1917820 RepID=A0A2P2D342_9LEPT|nr:YdeI/OmpD-associated family protein [Leptospira johnsonii]GBF39079.1 bacteriocin-protection protein, YdeI/OmpD-associated family [Leptospira johnsonii]
MIPKFFKTGKEFRTWLSKNHKKESELLLGFYKTKSSKKGIPYGEAIDQALCFGWIDGVRKNIDEESYSARFTPRKIGSIWSRVNIKRIQELIVEGLVQESGLQAFHSEKKKTAQYSFEQEKIELPSVYKKKFQKNTKSWEFFTGQAPSYQRTAIWWVISPKREETRLKRLDILISDSQSQKRIDALNWKKKPNS